MKHESEFGPSFYNIDSVLNYHENWRKPPTEKEPKFKYDKWGNKYNWVDGFWSLEDNRTRQQIIGNNKCALCDEQATEKLRQEIFPGEVMHDLNNYYCSSCFMAIISPFWKDGSCEDHQWLRKLVKEYKNNAKT